MPLLSDSQKANYRLLKKAASGRRTILVVTVVCSVLGAIMEGLGVGLIIPFVQNLVQDGGGDFATNIGWIDTYVLGLGLPEIVRLHRIAGSIVVLAFFRSVLGFVGGYYGSRFKEHTSHQLRMLVNDQSLSVALSYYSHARAGEIVSIATNESQRVRYMLELILSIVLRSGFAIAYAMVMITISVKLSVVALSLFVAVSIALTLLTRWIRRSSIRVPLLIGNMTAVTTETIAGMRLVRSWSMMDGERVRYETASLNTANQIVETERRNAMMPAFGSMLSSLMLMGIIVWAVQYQVIPGLLEPEYFLAFLLAMMRLAPIVQQINGARGGLAVVTPALTAIREYVDPVGKPYLVDGTKSLDRFEHSIKFDDVSFAYDSGNNVLSNVSLEVLQGSTVALVGASGAGKTTLVDLLPRFIDPTEGVLLIDGVDARTYTLESLRQHIGVVSQEAFMFNMSVRENIAYGLDGATDEQILEAARKANAYDFIMAFPNGLDSELGDRGAAMSGGQRQRIEIARCFMRNPEILILDEATSALDSVSEQLVQESLRELMDGRTVFAIAHRLSTIRDADMVVVLEGGRVVETGKYDELLARKGALYRYHSLQSNLDLSTSSAA